MTWRERIVAARERGKFTMEDIFLWLKPNSCFVGEQRERYGLWFNLEMTGIGDFVPCGPFQTAVQSSLMRNDFDEAERLLDTCEDRALALKRTSSEPQATHP